MPRDAKPTKLRKRRPLSVGWREWAALPELGIAEIKVKVDTGARSSALHAFDVVRTVRDGVTWLDFSIHPVQRNARVNVVTRARMIDEREVRSSTGRTTLRPVIETPIVIGGRVWPIQITLVRRDLMGFRMLLGRQAVRGRFVVDPGRSYCRGRPRPEINLGEESSA